MEITRIPDLPYAEDAHPAHTMGVYAPNEKNGAALLFIHGGGWHAGSKAQWEAHALRYASMGYVCASMDYRLVPEHVFPAQVEDCLLALRHFRANASSFGFDPHRVAAMGSSSGGHLAAMLGASTDSADRPAALVCISAITDTIPAGETPDKLRALLARFAPQAVTPEDFRALSPIHGWDNATPPTLLVHGKHDQTVPVGMAHRAYERLRALGVTTDLLLVEDGPHGFAYGLPMQPPGSEQYAVMLAIDAFLAKHLSVRSP